LLAHTGAMDFLGVLSHLAAVKVRGGYYAGAESTRLSSVTITSGKAWFPCCTLDGTVDLCNKKPSSYYNPDGLKFYCEGHMYRPVKVTRVLPRFGRRTGGSIVTVIGENFGLSGSSPIVRINGRACQRTYFAPSVFRDQSSSDVITGVDNMYNLVGTGNQNVQARSLPGNALINAYDSATDSMKQQYPEHCWNGMQDDGTARGFNYGTATAPKYINQGESGVDTGGPCFPSHCSSCPVPTGDSDTSATTPEGTGPVRWDATNKKWIGGDSSNLKNRGAHRRCTEQNQILAFSSGGAGSGALFLDDTNRVKGCKGRGDDSVLCDFRFPYIKYPYLCPEDAPYTTRLKKAYTSTFFNTGAGFSWTNGPADIRRDYGHRRWQKYGMFASVDKNNKPVEGVTRITMGVPQFGTTSFGATTVKEGSFLVNAGTSLLVNGKCELLFGAGVTTLAGSQTIACGTDSAITVTAIADLTGLSGDAYCNLTVTTGTVDAVGANAPGTANQAATTCQGGAPVTLQITSPSGVAVSFTQSGTFVHVEDALALCGLDFRPLGTTDAGAVTDYDVVTSDLEDFIAGVTTVSQAAALANADTTLDVVSTQALLGTVGTFPIFVLCGKAILKVSAATRSGVATPNRLTFTANAGHGGLCVKGSPVRRLWHVKIGSNFQDTADEYFHATRDLDSFGSPTLDDPAYVMIYDSTKEINGEIVKVVATVGNGVAAADQLLVVSERGSFGTPKVKHVLGNSSRVLAVEVCRGSAMRIGPQAETGSNFFTAAISANAECQAFDGPTATDGRYCRLQIAGTADRLKNVNVGDVVRKVAQGRTRVAQGSSLVNSGTSLVVEDAAALMASLAVQRTIAVATADPAAGNTAKSFDTNFFVSCGGDTTLQVTAVSFSTNTLTVLNATASGLGSDATLAGACRAGDIVTVVRGVAELNADAGVTTIVVKGRCEYLLGGPPVKQTAAVTGIAEARDLQISCGDAVVTVTEITSYVLADDLCTLTVSTLPGSHGCTVANAKYVYNANIGTFPAHQEYTTTFDVLSTAELATSDVAEFSHFRYIKVDDEIMRILDLADGDTDEPKAGYERFTVARAQLGTLAAPHDRDAVVTLLPRMTELSQAVDDSASMLYFPSQADLIANNINVGSVAAAGTAGNIGGAIIAVASPTAARQVGGTSVAYFIKVDDEIMRIVASRTVKQIGTAATGDAATLTVLRAQKGTLATAHKAGATVFVLGCMDGDETGSNCGGSCKPCAAPAKGGPGQQERLICVTPAGESGKGPAGQGAGDLAVTVEASPGPKESPFRMRMAPGEKGWLDAASTSVSCISEQNRGFQYGAHEFVWGVHFKSDAQAEEVKVLDMAVDQNTGETYMVGTMRGAITLQGKHIAMNKKLLGKLRVDKAAITNPAIKLYLAGTATAFGDATTLKAELGTFAAAGDLVGATVIITTTGAAGTGSMCMGTVKASVVADQVLTISAWRRLEDTHDSTGSACEVPATTAFEYRIYHGKMSFIAKFSKDGRPVWLNKLDGVSTVTTAMPQAEITSIAVDPASGTHYVVGTFSDGLVATAPGTDVAKPKLNIYSIDPTTRVAAASTAATIFNMAQDSYGQVAANTLKVGAKYQEGFMIKYSSAGTYLASEVIKGKTDVQELVVENLKVRAFHASTSHQINTQRPKDSPAPTEKTKTSRNEVEYDRGVAESAIQGGGTERRSSIVLATSAATYFQAAGQNMAAAGALMDDWYNGLTITITCGKGMGQSRKIQDYDAALRKAYVQPHWAGNGEMTPDATSCYSISGKPSSHVHGEHWVNGGIYVTGRLINVAAVARTVCFGQMPDAYRDTGAPSVGIPVCAGFAGTVVNEELNFIAQYDKDLRSFWVRFLYDGDGGVTRAGAGDITAVAATDDMVFVTGTFAYHATATSTALLFFQNCTFDSATVSEGPPANTQPAVPTLKKLCRSNDVTRVNNINQLLPGEKVQPYVGQPGSAQNLNWVTSAASDYVVTNTLESDYVAVGTEGAPYNTVSPTNTNSIPTRSLMFTAAYDATGRLVWYHYTRGAAANNDAAALDLMIVPTAMAFVRPSVGNKPLKGYWKTLSDKEQVWTSRGQPPDATAAKDVSSERVDSATVQGGYIYIVGTIKSVTAEHYADFGITKYPLECSKGKTLGQKGQDLRKLSLAPCAGKIQSQGANKDVFLVKFAARGTPRTDWTMTEYGKSNVQPSVEWIRRTGLAGKDDEATSVAVHDLTGAIYVTGTYLSSVDTKYQGSSLGENRYKATAGSDGGNVYVAERTAGLTLNNGDDVFGLKAAGRVNAVGCPMQRAAPSNEHEERMGLTGIPDCTFYSHAASVDTPTGFVVKFNDNGDEVQRGNKNNKFQRSITGFVQTSIAGYITSIAPCTGSGDRATHELTGGSNCATSPSGCSCLVLQMDSKTGNSAETADAFSDFDTKMSGMRIRITSGKASGYDGIISAFKGASGVFYTIPALPAMPDERSQFTLEPWNSLQPNVHLATCTTVQNSLTTSGMGCTAYGVEWAKTIGWPIGQSKVTPDNPTNEEAMVIGTWTAVGTNGAAVSATKLKLNKIHEKKAGSTFYDGFLVELTTNPSALSADALGIGSVMARVTGTGATAYSVPDNANNGGHLTIACPDRAEGCPLNAGLDGAVTQYRFISKFSSTALGTLDLQSKGTRQQSWPQSVVMMDSDVYIGGWFKGFDRFRFGVEGVDETVGFRSVGDDTWETYLVKLSD
jgi:hypothetical protein